MDKGRLEAFSDGVLAIIITIMVLALGTPAGDGFEDLLELWPITLSYLISFLFVAIYWVNHHRIFNDAGLVNTPILWCNMAWLLVMSFIPFATSWVGSYPTSWLPVTLYFADMLLAAITFHLMYYLIECEAGKKQEFRLSPRNIISLATYALATALGWLCPIVAYVIVAAVTCWWMVPEKKGC